MVRSSLNIHFLSLLSNELGNPISYLEGWGDGEFKRKSFVGYTFVSIDRKSTFGVIQALIK